MEKTNQQFDEITAQCRKIFEKKLTDYGASWRIMRPQSVTDQIYIKANRIRTLETTGVSKVGDGIQPELSAIINYCIIGLIQLELGFSETSDLQIVQALQLYDKYITEAKTLLASKNHDYGEAWRQMRVTSYTDLILTKINRIKEIEEHHGKTEVSEGVDANLYDIINYAVFYLIKLN